MLTKRLRFHRRVVQCSTPPDTRVKVISALYTHTNHHVFVELILKDTFDRMHEEFVGLDGDTYTAARFSLASATSRLDIVQCDTLWTFRLSNITVQLPVG